MGDDHVKGPPVPPLADPRPTGQAAHPVPHLALGVLVVAVVVANRAAKAGDAQADLVLPSILHIDAANGALQRLRGVLGGEVGRNAVPPERRVVIAVNVQQRHPGLRPQVLEVVERQITTSHNEIRTQSPQPWPIQRLVDLIGDGENPDHGKIDRATAMIGFTHREATTPSRRHRRPALRRQTVRWGS